MSREWDASSARWSIALSGGGHRASLFAVGALLYLADSGRASQVDSIASVSGGSLTNGVVLRECDFQTTSGSDLRDVLAPLVGRCVSTGTVQYTPSVRVALGIGGAGLLGIASGVRAWLRGGRRSGRLRAIGSGALFAGAYQSLSWLAERAFNDQFFHDSTLAELDRPDRPVAHVFCATELQSGEHLYFSPRFGLSLPSRFTPSLRMPLARAVQTSAAFPVFPPRLFPAKRVGFPASQQPSLWLSDGGVYDNMGDEWARSYWAQVRRFGRMRDLANPPERLLVINATANGSDRPAGIVARIPLISAVFARVREIGIMHGSTTATRRLDLVSEFDRTRRAEQRDGATPPATLKEAEQQSLSRSFVRPPLGGTLVHIATDARWPSRRTSAPPGVDAAHFTAVQAALAGFADTGILTAAMVRAKDATLTLGRMDRDVVIDLIWHGYMLTMTNFAVFDGRDYAPIRRTEIATYVDEATAAVPA